METLKEASASGHMMIQTGVDYRVSAGPRSLKRDEEEPSVL